MFNKVLVSLLFLLISNFTIKAQSGVLKGRVIDDSTLEPLPFANVFLEDRNKVRIGASTNIDGNFIINSKSEGTFIVITSYIGYIDKQINNVSIKNGDTTILDIKLKPSIQTLKEVVIIVYEKPLVEQDQGSGARLSRNTFNRAPRTKKHINNQVLNNTSTIPEREYNDDNEVDILPGQLTASELNDFSKWELWQDINKNELKMFQELWEVSPQFRYSVQIKANDEKPIVDAMVILQSTDGTVIWSCRSDNTGKAELWLNLYEKVKNKDLEIVVNYKNKKYTYSNPNIFKEGINVLKIPVECDIPNQIDIAFVVDATGSMEDEIAFLKTDLVDIIQKAKTNFPETPINLGSVFYRCFGNSYVTKLTPLSVNIENTIGFINAQDAREGGDEVVEEAFQVAVDSLKWGQSARTRLLFFVLDQQPLVNPDVIKKLHLTIKKAAEKGIRVIPVIASAESPENASSLEYLMRSIALTTNGTYVFLTDHSGIGDTHAKPVTDQYDVELLNNLIRRLIYQFSYIPRCGSGIIIDGISDTTYFSNSPIIAHEIIDSTRNIKTKSTKVIIQDFSSNTNSDTLKPENKTDTLARINLNKTDVSPKVKKIEVKFFPNPTSGKITVEIEGKIDELYLTDISGKLISKYSSARKSRLEIDLSKYSTGIYFIKFRENYKWYSGKIILTH
jgi:hypothetical protein